MQAGIDDNLVQMNCPHCRRKILMRRMECQWCGEVFYAEADAVAVKFCSDKCRSEQVTFNKMHYPNKRKPKAICITVSRGTEQHSFFNIKSCANFLSVYSDFDRDKILQMLSLCSDKIDNWTISYD